MRLNFLGATALAIAALASCGGGDSATDTTARPVSVAQLHPDIARLYADSSIGFRCSQPLVCNGVVRVDCAPEVDGPQIYFAQGDGQVLMNCGGTCMAPDSKDPKSCKTCPPRSWTCSN